MQALAATRMTPCQTIRSRLQIFLCTRASMRPCGVATNRNGRSIRTSSSEINLSTVVLTPSSPQKSVASDVSMPILVGAHHTVLGVDQLLCGPWPVATGCMHPLPPSVCPMGASPQIKCFDPEWSAHTTGGTKTQPTHFRVRAKTTNGGLPRCQVFRPLMNQNGPKFV